MLVTTHPANCPSCGAKLGRKESNVLINRRYFDEEKWELITETEAAQSLEKFYVDAGPVMQDLAAGERIRTDVAEYQAAREP